MPIILDRGAAIEERSRHKEFLNYTCSIQIDVQPQTVFAIVSDIAHSDQWAGSGYIKTIKGTTDGPVGVGARFRSLEKITMKYRAETEVVAFIPDEFIMWRSKPVGEPVPYHLWSFRLSSYRGGTALVHEVRARRARGPMGLVQGLGFLFTRPTERIPSGMERTLTNVKALAETGAIPPESIST